MEWATYRPGLRGGRPAAATLNLMNNARNSASEIITCKRSTMELRRVLVQPGAV